MTPVSLLVTSIPHYCLCLSGTDQSDQLPWRLKRIGRWDQCIMMLWSSEKSLNWFGSKIRDIST